MDFQTTLLRERFVLRDLGGELNNSAPVVAVSNRIVLNLPAKSGVAGSQETYVVRAQSMYACTRLAGKLLQTYEMDGPLTGRAHLYDWKTAWENVNEDHERKYNPDRWAAIYANGEVLWSSGKHHNFLDIIERCEVKNKGRYEQSLRMAEHAFTKLGKNVRIDYDGGIGLVVNMEGNVGRIGVMLRGAEKKASFNFVAEAKDSPEISIAHCLMTAAAFLEGIQLSFRIGSTNEKVKLEVIAETHPDYLEAESALRRLGKLNNAISIFEQTHNVRYRPERPLFEKYIRDAEIYARKLHELKAANKENA